MQMSGLRKAYELDLVSCTHKIVKSDTDFDKEEKGPETALSFTTTDSSTNTKLESSFQRP